MSLSDRIDDLLKRVEKPIRYVGGEFGAVMKEPASVKARYAFLFPDAYEVGMSHLGMKLLYHMINERADAYCERVFSPWPDMEKLMRENGVPLFSLETRTPVGEFDILGITLQYEMSYSNILAALDMAGIALRSADRTSGPFVICGGPCAFNPEPLAPFVDLFVLGDGEESTHATIDALIEWKERGGSREDYLRAAAKIPGVYVPSLYRDGDAPVKKAMVLDLDKAYYPETLIVPYGEIVHNRIMLEIFRGCTRGCRFCQAGMIYRPVRERSLERLVYLAEKLVASTGYDEVSLMSLSSGDYSRLAELARELTRRFESKRVSISLPSQRIDALIKDTLKETHKLRGGGLTLAPEAGTQRLRDVINKGGTEEDLMRAVTEAFEEGLSSVKLYFMLGLPTETDEDVLGIADLARKVRSAYFSIPKERRSPGLRITVSASVFVPKPFTPFQWVGQCPEDEVIRRQHLLKRALAGVKGVEFKYHAPDLSLLEATFALGGQEMADVLQRAFELGCRFDGWSDQFDYAKWLQAFGECGISPADVACRPRGEDEPFPWERVDAGVTRAFLLSEYKKALAAETTRDCRAGCVGCGIKRYEGACV